MDVFKSNKNAKKIKKTKQYFKENVINIYHIFTFLSIKWTS